MKKILLLFVSVCFIFSSCVKSNIEGTDPVISNFDWKTTTPVAISVPTPAVETAYQGYATTIKIYSKPLYVSKFMLSEGAAYTGKPYSTTIDLPAGIDTLFVWAKLPTGVSKFYKYIVSGTKAYAVTSASSTMTKAMYKAAPLVPAPTPVPASYNGTFTSSNVELWASTTTMRLAGNWLVKGPITAAGCEFLNQGNINRMVFISGNVVINNSSLTNVDTGNIIVLPGSTLTFTGPIYLNGSAYIDVQEGATVNFNQGVSSGQTSNTIVNRGTINIGVGPASNAFINTTIYNVGTFNIANGGNTLGIESGTNFYNYGSLDAQYIEANSGNCVLENEVGGEVVCTSMDLANATTQFNNYGNFACSGNLGSSSGTINNSGYLACDSFTDVDKTTVNCTSGSLFSVKTFLVNDTKINMDPQSIIVIDKFQSSTWNCSFINSSKTDYGLVVLGMQVGTSGTLTADASSKIDGTTMSNTYFDGAIEVYYPNAANATESESWTHNLCNKDLGGGKEGPAYFGHDATAPSRINNIPDSGENLGAGVISGSTPTDTDGDGVPDTEDAFPTDPQLAYVTYFPSETGYCSYIFEDKWPEAGDYDLNDIVLYCNIGYYKNASNNVVYEKVKWKAMAAGCSYWVAAGVQLDGITPSQITSVTNDNSNLKALPIGHSMSNGCESGQTYAVFPFFNNPNEVLDRETFVNVKKSDAYVVPQEHVNVITFASPVAETLLGMDKFNAFIVVSRDYKDTDRGREVHLMNFGPTNLMDATLLTYDANASGEIRSASNPFKTKTGLVWALMVPKEFRWCVESNSISTVYAKYVEWYTKNTEASKLWYDTSVSGNVNDESLLYQ